MKEKSDYEELIKAGVLDITTREAVEDENDHKARNAEPSEYALTYLQHVLLLRATNTIETVLIQRPTATKDATTGEKINIIDPGTAQTIRKEWRKRNIRLDSLRRICDVLNGNYYTLYISAAYQPPTKSFGFSLFACVDGVEMGGILNYDEYPQIYSHKTRKEQREALRLPESAKFLFSVERASIEQIQRLLTDKQQQAAHRPQNYIIPKDNITRKYMENRLPYDQQRKVKTGDAKHTLVTRSTTSLKTTQPGVTMGKQFTVTEFHDSVFNAICSYAIECEERKAWPLVFFDGGICETLGISNTQQNRDRVYKVMLDFISDTLTIDSATTSDQYGFSRRTLKDTIVSAIIEEGSIKTQYGEGTTRKYTMKNIPLLLAYNQLLRVNNGAAQLLRIPQTTLIAPQESGETKIYNTKSAHDLKIYLAERVKSIPQISNRILYDTIFDHLGIKGDTPSVRNKKSDTRKRVRQIMNTLKKEKIIKAWHEETAEGKPVKIDKNGNAPRGTVSRVIIVKV